MIFGLVFLLVLPAGMPAFGWDTIISFGDSLSDDGNGGYNNFPLYLPPGATGPASDGPVWLNYLAESMTDVELEGRAIGGARTSGPIWGVGDIGMEAQVDRYISSLDDGEPPEGGYDLSGILFTVWIGGNDFLANPANPFAVIDTAINRIEASIQDLVDAGAEDILVMTMPDLGLAPGIVYLDYANGANGVLIAAYTYASEQFNESLTERICTLRDMNDEANVKFYMADTFKLLQYAVENGEALGFENVNIPCTWPGGPNCDVAIFWDGIHPTTATHKYLAALALGQVKHGRISKEMKDMLKELNPIHPRKPFVVNCFE
jgi:phospholipase/lecithinase/hemolysin